MGRIAIDYTEQTLGGFEAISRTDRKQNGSASAWLWKMRCLACGKVVELVPSAARKQKSCGCRDYDTKDWTGQEVGGMVALERLGTRGLWRMRCLACSRVVEKVPSASGDWLSCGCRWAENIGLAARERYANDPKVLALRAAVMEARAKGWTFKRIGEAFGFSHQRAVQIYQRATRGPPG